MRRLGIQQLQQVEALFSRNRICREAQWILLGLLVVGLLEIGKVYLLP